MALVRSLRDQNVIVDVVPRLYELVGPRADIHLIEGLPLLTVPPARLSEDIPDRPSGSSTSSARGFLLLLTSPVFVVAAIKIKRESPGPIFFRQTRLGLNQRPFTALKFRTMKVGTDHSEHREYIKSTMTADAQINANGTYKLDRDAAVTPFGRLLRKTSLDELPQLLNILRGEMSLVGPRPCIEYETEFFQPHHFDRFLVPQGLTGLWQVTARANSTFGEALEMDVAYVRGWSLGLDLQAAFPDAVRPSPPAEGNRVNPVRVAVVGLGYWGPNLARNFQELECAELAAICDARPDAPRADRPAVRGRRARRRGSKTCSTTTRSTRWRSRPRSRRISRSHARRSRPASTCSSRSHSQHRPRECLELIRLAEERGLVLMPGHTFLYSPPVVAIRELIEAGALGEICFISTSRVNLGLHQADVSVTWDLGPHDFSILRYWLDEGPTNVSALTRGYVIPAIPDVAFIDLEFPSGTIAHVELSWLAPSKLRRTTIVGSEKMVVYDDTSTEPVRIFDSGVELQGPRDLRRVPAHLSRRRHRLAAHRCG